MPSRLAVILLLAAGCVPAAAPVVAPTPATIRAATPPTGDAAEDYADIRGGRVAWPTGAAATVLVFLGNDCPVSNRYAPEITRLRAEFADRNVAFWVVYADADLSAANAKRHAEAHGLASPAIVDPGLTLARRSGATVKPEAVVLNPDGRRVYLGRIDDSYVDFGRRRPQPTRRDLHAAIVATLAGKPATPPYVPAIGCDIDFEPRPIYPPTTR